jgi:hypothetical protein
MVRLKDVLQSDKPVLVDFWGRMVRPLSHVGPDCRGGG